jgi:hypothetical protein
VEDLNNKKAAIIPIKTAIGDGIKNHAIRYRHPKRKNKTNKGIKAYGFPVFFEKIVIKLI